MAEEEKKTTANENEQPVSKIPFTNVLEILANKVSRKAVIVAMAMILIYLLAATPNVAEVLLFVGAITGLAVFFTLLQWIIDLKDDRRDRRGRDVHSDPPKDPDKGSG